MKKVTFGVIVGNRGFFPDVLAKEGRRDILDVLKQNGYGAVTLSTTDTKHGAVVTFEDVRKCAELFASKADDIDGIIITLPNFGEERANAEVIKRSGLSVPILIQAEEDIAGQMKIDRRRDSFCGKISTCNNLRQAGIPFSLTRTHTVKVTSPEFKTDLNRFAATCRVIRGLKNVRFGAIGSRPAAFNTVRYSEKMLEYAGIAVEPVDLYEILGKVGKLSDNDKAVKAKLNAIKKYTVTDAIPIDGLLKMAKFGAVVDRWIKDNELVGTAIQCWTALEEYFGIVPCTLMSMMSESLLPSACEVDVTGLLAMYILQLAGGAPSALLDWNNNVEGDPNKCVLFHCSNLPKSFFQSDRMDYQEIIAGSVGKENTYGTIVGRIKPGPATFCRTTTDDTEGVLRAYVGQGRFTDDALDTFGGYGVMEISNLQTLLSYICRMGFEHHVAVNLSETADAIAEALGNYLAWDVYHHC
ncbi:MAG: L-fucose/L-arabinose isomerase family protein [Sedimentisphaerales bacterium]|nr:L-fucose/L-arabinose isomerase family protein [Sedimentisphaerales bacterium]